MELWDNENIITRSDTNDLVLTNHRIQYKYKRNYTSIMLDQVSGIDVRYASKSIFLLLALLFLAGSAIIFNSFYSDYSLILIVAAIISAIVYFNSRKHIVEVSSASTKITFYTQGISTERIQELINQIEKARGKLLKL